jgi:hypothetical protein
MLVAPPVMVSVVDFKQFPPRVNQRIQQILFICSQRACFYAKVMARLSG